MAQPDPPSILIVSAHFPPSPAIGGKRPHKIARILADSGWDTTVLTIGEAAKVEHHPSTAGNFVVVREAPFLPKPFFRRFQSSPAATAPATKPEAGTPAPGPQRATPLLKKAASRALSRIQGIDEWAWWNRSLGRTLKQPHFDVVLVTVPPFSIALGALKLSKRFNAKFVLDYRDPWTDLPDKELYLRLHGRDMTKTFAKMEARCLDAAQLVVTVSPAIERMLEERRSDLPVKTVPQGYTGVISDANSVEDFFLYAGSLAYGRSLSGVLAALVELNRGSSRRVTLKYCGDHTDFASEQAEAVGALDLLENLGSLGQSDVDELARRALGSFVIVSPRFEYAYPGKLFDLVNSGRPILVISNEPCEAGKLVQEFELGQSFDRHDLDRLPEALAALQRSPDFRHGEKAAALEDRVVLAQLEAELRNLVT